MAALPVLSQRELDALHLRIDALGKKMAALHAAGERAEACALLDEMNRLIWRRNASLTAFAGPDLEGCYFTNEGERARRAAVARGEARG